MSTVIKVESLSKLYRLGNTGTGSLAHDINRAWYRMRGKGDPYIKIGEENDRAVRGASEYIWALKDIDFEVSQGEVLGIIGRNGAGKSTLLKILSRTTSPTTGSIKIKGRVASLLEVGTGFHAELTGRENIFLNGAILGMTRREIKSKLDEIVEFTGVERFIDTPVKRYSSGMFVRLAFGVAAHLDPEILIIDEVLAVGDAEFQKKALGKMKDVSGKEGRTVLFVSHIMMAAQALCTKVIYLNNGLLKEIGNTREVINSYSVQDGEIKGVKVWNRNRAPGNIDAKLVSVKIVNPSGNVSNYIEDKIIVETEVMILRKDLSLNVSLSFYDENDYYIVAAPCPDRGPYKTGVLKSLCTIPANFFNTGTIFVSVLLVGNDYKIITQVDKVLKIEYSERGEMRNGYYGYWGGVVRPNFEWENRNL